jgi:hypothetical protein
MSIHYPALAQPLGYRDDGIVLRQVVELSKVIDAHPISRHFLTLGLIYHLPVPDPFLNANRDEKRQLLISNCLMLAKKQTYTGTILLHRRRSRIYATRQYLTNG